MLRKAIKILVPVAALACVLAGLNIVSSDRGQANVTRVDFDQIFTEATAMARRDYTPATMAVLNFNHVFADTIATSSRQYTSPIMAMATFDRPFADVGATPATTPTVNFNQAFADATATPRPVNTPPNREKLRNAGWKRLLGSS